MNAYSNNKTNRAFFLGIDGGGTKTVFRLVDENGTIIHECIKGASNPNDIGMESALSILKSGIAEACAEIPFSEITMFAGIAGGGMSGNNAVILERFFSEFGFFAFENGSDIENLVALSDADPRVLVIMGTGFIAYALSGTERKRIAGWGQFFDDGGSGYTLGKDAITAALCAGDGSGAPTLLCSLIEEKVGESAEAHLARFYQGGKSYIAGFSELVFKAAEKGDAVALSILEKNFAFAAHRIDTAIAYLPAAEKEIPVFLAGGITAKSEVIFPIMKKYLKSRCQLIRLTREPIEGAVRRAQAIGRARIR